MTKIIGIDFQRVVSYSSSPENRGRYNSINGIFTGLRWECVEFVRRWYILNFGVSFSSIPKALDIIPLRWVYFVSKDNKMIPFYFSKTWLDIQIGDIVVFERSNKFPYGHISIVTFRDEDNVYLSEQNFSDEWESFQYSRKIPIKELSKNGALGYKTIHP